jgi:hypothetical protein
MSDASGGGAAGDAMVKTNGQADETEEDANARLAKDAEKAEKEFRAARKAEKDDEIAAAKRAVDVAEEQLKAAKEALAEARKGTD